MCEKLENKLAILLNNNYLTQYGNNVVFFGGIPENVPDNNLESTVISVVSDIEIEVEPQDIDTCHRIGKPTPKTQKEIVRFIK